MANVLSVQILEEGPRNAVVKVTGFLDTSNIATTTLIDLTTLNQSGTGKTPTRIRVDKIEYSISSQLQVHLAWNATADVMLAGLVGWGKMKFTRYGGANNNAGAGIDGNIDITTYGWTAGTQLFTLVMHLVKQGADL